MLGLVCPYGSKCSFAHGHHELRSKLIVPVNFKTVKCKQFHEECVCNYGPRCQFVHLIDTDKNFKPSMINYRTIFDGLLGSFQKEENGDGIKNMDVFLNKTANVEGFGLSKLRVFAEMREEF